MKNKVIIFLLFLIFSYNVYGQSVSLSSNAVNVGGALTVTWSGFSGLVNVYVAQGSNNKWIPANTQGGSSGSQLIGTDATWGVRADYNVWIEQKSNISIFRTSQNFSVNNPYVTLSTNSMTIGGGLTVTWSGYSSTINIYVAQGSNNKWKEVNTQGSSSGSQWIGTDAIWGVRSDYRIYTELKTNTNIYSYSNYFSVTGIPVNPQVSISPSSGTNGTTFQEPGSGFTPNGTATLYFSGPYGSSTLQKTIGSNGIYTNSWTCNACPSGNYSYYAIDNSSGKTSNTVYFTTFIANPQVSVSPSSGTNGTTFQEPGSGFTPNGTATLYFSGPDGSSTLQKTIGSNGTFSNSWTCNACPSGSYSYYAVDNSSGKTSNTVYFTTFTANPQVSVSPSSGTNGTTFQEPGSGFTPNGTATLYFTGPDGSSTLQKTIGSDGTYINSWTCNACPSGSYSYYAVDNSSSKTSNTVYFNVENDQVTLNLPTQEEIVLSPTITFKWSSIANATRYELYVDNNSGLGSPEVSPLTITDLKTSTSFTLSANWLTPGGYYYWKVVAITPTGKIESTIGTFTYSPTPDPAPKWVPLYKTFNPDIVDHFYCSSDTHLKEAVTNKYRFEGVEGYVALQPFVVSSPNKLLPIYRFLQTDIVNTKMSCHFYTTDSIDRDNRIIQGWTYEGIVGYGLKLPEEGLTSLYHTYLNVPNARRDNFYTVSEIQKNNSISLFGYTDIGAVCYISATGDNSTMPWLSTSPEVGMGANPLNGNLSNYTTNIFTIPEGKVGLNYGHLYSSLAVRFLSNNNPLGNGWSHSYNISLSVNESNVFVFWPDEVNLFNKTSLKSITPGVYDILTQQSSTKYQIKKKDQTVYTFEKLANVTNTDNTYMLTSITDRFGNQISLSYNNQGWLKTVKSPKNRYLSFTYYSQSDTARFGLIHYVKDSLALNRTVEYIYDSQRNLISFIDAKKQTTAYTYNTDSPFDHFLDTVTYADGTKISNKFDPVSKRLTSQSFISNQTNKLTTINNIGTNQYKVTDETGKYTSYMADATGNMTELLTPSGKATCIYTDLSNTTKPTDIIDGKGNHTTVSYNAMGDPLVINKPLNIIHKYQWNTTNDLVKYTNPLNNETNFTYIDGKLTAVTTPRGTTNMTYFTNGNVNTVNDPLSQTITYNYDTLNNVKSVTEILGNSTQYDYDAASRAIKVIDANQKSNYYNYDNNDLLISTVDALNKTTQNTYDAANRLISVKDARQNITSMTFDVNTGLLNQITDQLQKQINYSYYDNGLLKSTTNRNKQTINYTYDDDNRLANVNGPSINRGLTYDLNDKVIQITDNNDTLKFEYDELNRLKSQTDFFSNQVKYEYNEVGGVKKITYPIINKSVLYDYYSDNLLKTVTDWDSRITTYTYRNDGSIDKITLPNGTFTQYSYDAAGRLTGLENKKSDGTVINSYTYTLDAVGNHISVTTNEPLTAPELTAANLSYSYDKANRILNSGSTTYLHDSNGNMLSQNDNGFITGFTYDVENKLTGVSGSIAATYGYDAMGYRRYATRNGVTTRYVLDVNGSMENVLMETDPSNVPLYYYIQGNGLLYRIKASDNSVQYYHYDSRGSTIAITDQNQNITHKYTYDSFGKVTNSIEADFNPYRYVGQYGVVYEDSDLYFMRARYYKPGIGRFLSEDPVWNTNLYSYVENNPFIKTDANGMNSIVEFGVKVGYQIVFKGKELFYNPQTYSLYTFKRLSNGEFAKGSIKTFSLVKLSQEIISDWMIDKTSEALFGKGEDPKFVEFTNYIPLAGPVIRNIFGNVQSASGDLDPKNPQELKQLKLQKSK